MIGFIIWIIGVVLCVKAVLEIMKWPVDGAISCNYHPAHKLDWNLCLLLLGKGKPASNTEISSSIIYRRVLRTRGIDNSYPLLFRNSVGLSPNCSL